MTRELQNKDEIAEHLIPLGRFGRPEKLHGQLHF
jgi:CylG protein